MFNTYHSRSGFYRVNYDIDNWKELIKQLKDDPTVIHAINRAQLIDDAFNLAIAGHLDYAIPLGLSEYLEKENSVTPWYSAKNCFSFLIDRMRRSEQGYENVKVIKRFFFFFNYPQFVDFHKKFSC